MVVKERHEDEGDEIAEGPHSYEELAKIAPLREDMEEPAIKGEDGEARSLSDAVDLMPDLSDMQTAAMALFPKELGDTAGNKLMVGRIAPDAFLDLIGMRVNNRLMTSDPTKEIDFDRILTEEYVLASIGLDGKGRIDYAELVGAAREQKELKDRFREL